MRLTVGGLYLVERRNSDSLELGLRMPGFLAMRLTMLLTARSVRTPPLRLAKTGSLAPALLRGDRSDRPTTSMAGAGAPCGPCPGWIVARDRREAGRRPQVRATISETPRPPA